MARKTKTIPPKTKGAPVAPPTRAEAETLQAFYDFVEKSGRAPMQKELSAAMGKSPAAAQVPLENLEAKGYIEATIVQARGPLRITALGEAFLQMFGATETKPKRKRAS